MELTLSLRKLARVAHEWKTPFYIVKLDIEKAFDSVAQQAQGDLVMRKIALGGDPVGSAALAPHSGSKGAELLCPDRTGYRGPVERRPPRKP